jgi:hypothetical protein
MDRCPYCGRKQILEVCRCGHAFGAKSTPRVASGILSVPKPKRGVNCSRAGRSTRSAWLLGCGEPRRPMGNCPECGVVVRVDRMQKHLAKVHSGAVVEASKQEKTKSVKARVMDAASKKSGFASDSRGSSNFLKKSFDGDGLRESDPRDASKYWGYLARDNGQFGSYPLHDDFGDESDPY